ncbi:MAG: ParB/RepB/Spo0J family partition protein [Phycisphaerae bacterium]
MVSTRKIRCNPFQPRKDFDSDRIRSLAESIRRCGVLQPVTVRRVGLEFELIAGERRWQAAQSIGLKEIPAMVREATDEQMLEMALVENIQREDLNAVDRALAYRQFCDAFGLTAAQVADRLGEDRSTVANYLRLLDLDDVLRAKVARGELSMGHARCLLGVADVGRRRSLAERVARGQLSVRALEKLARSEREGATLDAQRSSRRDRSKGVHLRDLEQRFELSVKTKVTIHEGKRKGSGRIVIEYFSLEDFDRVAGLLGVELE